MLCVCSVVYVPFVYMCFWRVPVFENMRVFFIDVSGVCDYMSVYACVVCVFVCVCENLYVCLWFVYGAFACVEARGVCLSCMWWVGALFLLCFFCGDCVVCSSVL